MHAHNKSLWCLFVVCTHSSVFVVPSFFLGALTGGSLSYPTLRFGGACGLGWVGGGVRSRVWVFSDVLGTTNMLEWVHTTYMICCVHACTVGTNTANLSKPTACMNCSIASTLPRTCQDKQVVRPHRRHQLATV